jgi:L-2-hydroxyglutarate oxidase
MTYEVAIIGGGIVGMATAMALSSRLRNSLLVVEAEERLAAHQTGHNSGVIHSGLYYKPGSLKARNCVTGREALYRFCEEHGIAYERCGKVVVATEEWELPALEELERRGRANGLDDVRRMTPDEVREREPHVAAIAALYVPATGIVDFVGATHKYGEVVMQAGGTIHTQAAVRRVRRMPGELVLETTAGEFHCRHLINCGGLMADRVARMCGVDPRVKIVPFRGEYYELVPERQFLVKHLIYPVPDPRFPFLGVHFTRMVKGGIEAGPNAVLALARYGYRWSNISPRDLLDWAGYAGFWRMSLAYWRTGLAEYHRSLSKRAFVHQLQRLIPELRMDDVHRGGAGVRAMALAPDGKLVDDFQIERGDRMIHVLNAPSPAATASITIGQEIAQMAFETFELS